MALALLPCACSSATPFSLQGVEPAEGDATKTMAVRIVGENFVSVVRANFDDSEQSTISATYRATLGGVELVDVRRVSKDALTATIPGGVLAAGTHELVVTDGAGRSAQLAAAFTALGGTPGDGGDAGGDGDAPSSDADAGPSPDADAAPRPDVLPPDTTRPDTTGDTSPPIGPVSQSALSALFLAARVPCVNRSGQSTGTMMPIVDTGDVRFFDWATVVQPSAPSSTRAWVGSRSAVAVRFNPNACDGESVFGGNEGWVTACVIVRGARLDAQGRLVLEPSVTLSDMDLVNCRESGTMQQGGEFALPDDSQLPTNYPQLVNPIGAVKQGILDASRS
ncbi:MAG: hypothetical protein KC503_15915 [Myxococcales bacterium]|nr:hypothetical protein [Myxococcales bacterium]